ncbi:MAG: GNAT family N-acetyltransferase [Acidimicrobiales bacterium]|nr:GNAT family N-acetyltransferase [Acidimicrobiales bacterium]
MTFRVEPLDDQDLAAFDSGTVELDDWLRLHARTATGQGTRTYVLVDDDDLVVGYFAIAPHLLGRDDAPSRLARGAPEQIPAILLAKLALDSSLQGQGLGAELLIAALEVVVTAARSAGGRVVLVDAIDDVARTFYEHHDLELLPGKTHRLIMKLSTAARAMGVRWP